jgi:YbbR domain-containing protein
MLYRLRENWLLKIISLVASVLLWLYVQAERPPNMVRTVFARVIVQNQPEDADIGNVPQQIPISIFGPSPNVERVKDLDTQALLDLRNINVEKPSTVPVRPTIVLPDYARNVAYDPPLPIKVQVNPQQQTQMTIVPLYPNEPPAGFHYASPEIRPRIATLTGLAQQLNQVERVVVNAAPPEPGASIDGDFTVLALDKDKKVVQGVKIDPERVHVTVPLKEEPAAKVVTVSPSLVEQPQPPYVLKAVSVKPNQVRVKGPLERLNQLYTLSTEDIPIKTLSGDQTIKANLLIPPDLTAYGSDGQRIATVTVTVSVGKVGDAAPTPPANPSTDKTEPPRP